MAVEQQPDAKGGASPEAEELLVLLLRRKEGLRRGVVRAVRMLLAEWRSKHLATDLTANLEVHARIDVFPKNMGGGQSCGFGGAVGEVELVRKMPGWPPAVRYRLTDLPRPGDLLVVAGTHPIGCRRMECPRPVGRGFSSSMQGITPTVFRLRCLSHLLRSDLNLAPLAWTGIRFKNDEQYLRDARRWLAGIRRDHADLLLRLSGQNLLSSEDSARARLSIDLTIHDARPEESRTPLPEVE